MITRLTHPTTGRMEKRDGKPGAFSLIEVTLSIGIIAFALLAVVALLPVGIGSIRTAADQQRATQVMNGIAIAIQSARLSGTNSAPTTGASAGNWKFTYAALPPYDRVASSGTT